MILQKLLFPNRAICTREPMYYNGQGITVFMEDPHVKFSTGAKMDTMTYFNSFSVGKWKKYTILNNLQLRLALRGEFQIHIHHARRMNGSTKDLCLLDRHIFCEERQEVTMAIPLEETDGAYYFCLRALSDDAQFFGGAYETDVDISALPEVKIGVGICACHNEKSVTRNLDRLRKEILEDPESPMNGRLEVFLSDNGQSLPESLETENIHIFPNKNLGSAGGFARSMIEIHKVHQDRGITHILLMDDVLLNPDSLLRTCAMLRLIKPGYRDAFVGGHILKLDQPHIQSEAAGYWQQTNHRPVKQDYELEDFNLILKNEIEDKVNYLGWQYCCMPVGTISDTNLPLPVFSGYEDVEYALRNGKKFITLNGICVWKESSEYKYAACPAYYSFRNLCMMNAAHRRNFNGKALIKELKEYIRTCILTCRYREAEMALLGVQHYLKGVDWLTEQDGEKLDLALKTLDYKKKPIEDLNTTFTYDSYEKKLKPQNWNRKMKLIGKLTFNGHLLPANRTALVPACNPNTRLFFRVKKAVNFEEATGSAFVTFRSWKNIRYIFKMYCETAAQIRRKYKSVTEEYRARYNELTGIQFWNRWLFSTAEVDEIKSGLEMYPRPQNTRRDYYVTAVCAGLRLMQCLLFWLPVKKNRVIFYAHERKGATCSLKYILNQLREQFGDKLELIWVSGYPETCQELRDMGIPVLRVNTKQHIMAYLRARFYITNDNFPIWAIHRPGQKWLNTWHGAMNYKHIGYDYLGPLSSLGSHIFKMKNRQPDFYLSGSRFFTEDTAKSFRLKEKVFLPTGLPRNDIMFTQQETLKKKICSRYQISAGKKLVIYAPTFRKNVKSSTYGMDFEGLTQALGDRFGGEWVVLFRNHSFVKNKSDLKDAVDVSDYFDMQELMCVADLLISDYSSCLYDFALSGRPSLVYATDLQRYINDDRSLAYPVSRWPYPMAQNNQELADVIANFDQQAYDAAFRQHKEDIGGYDKGDATKQVVEIVKKYCL